MKISESWLREWVSPSLDAEDLAAQLTMAGLEVGSLEAAAPAFGKVLVGRILEIEDHPDADRLRVCTVDAGAAGRLRIVCGAANARAGVIAPVALAGAELPGGTTIKAAAVRGVHSDGMLCSAKDLGVSDGAEGLLELPPDAPVGEDLRRYLKYDDSILSLELTPNRGDCLSVRGVAREVAVLNGAEMRGPVLAPVPAKSSDARTVRIEDEAACSAYAGRVVTGIRADAVTPFWMRERLRRGGLRSIHPVVDVTNYVLLELGQPMHGFDLQKLNGGISVRRARQGESLALLDGQTVQLDPGTLVIADESGPVAMAGVMGGLDSGVTAGTTDIFFESACFTPAAVAGQGRRYKLHTDSLHRFERGLDPTQQAVALERATQLLIEIAGGTPGPISLAQVPRKAPAPVRLRHARLMKLLGAQVPAVEVERILRTLGMHLSGSGGEWQVIPPSWRQDISIEVDLIEEVARIHGYARLPLSPTPVSLPAVSETESVVPEARIRELFCNRGYQEVVTYSFVDPALQKRLDPEAQAIDLDNPIAAQLAQMRTTLWSSLLPAWVYNVQRQQSRVRLFELGMRFARDAAAPHGIRQETALAGLISGSAEPEQWGRVRRDADFHDLRGDVEAALRLGGAPDRFRIETAEHPALHPGQSARVLWDSEVAGWFGRLHPGLAGLLDVKVELPLVFELGLGAVRQARLPSAKHPTEYPFIRRDLALELPESVSAAALLHAVQDVQDVLLKDILIFDVYRGRGLQSGFKSVALGLIFQDYSRTLTDTEVDQSIARLRNRLKETLGAKGRG